MRVVMWGEWRVEHGAKPRMTITPSGSRGVSSATLEECPSSTECTPSTECLVNSNKNKEASRCCSSILVAWLSGSHRHRRRGWRARGDGRR